MATIWGGDDHSISSPGWYDASGVWGARWPVWQAALRLILEHPVIGVGAGVFEVAEGPSHGGSGKWSTVHNSFLQIGAELGIPGLALFVFLLYWAVKNCHRVIRLARQRRTLEETQREALFLSPGTRRSARALGYLERAYGRGGELLQAMTITDLVTTCQKISWSKWTG